MFKGCLKKEAKHMKFLVLLYMTLLKFFKFKKLNSIISYDIIGAPCSLCYKKHKILNYIAFET